MTAASTTRPSVPIAGATRVDLDELIALRLRVHRGQQLHPVVARAARSGAHVSRLRGRGMDYAESRAYQPGDDVRQVDWRLTARSGRLHTKLYQEERERSMLLLIDTNPSMHFGTRRRFKSVQCARAAALAAWSASHADERVGALAFGACRELQRPRPGHRGVLATLGALARWDAVPSSPGGESLADALRRAARVARGSSRLLVISDGASCGEDARAPLVQLRRQVDVAVLVVADVLELAMPPPGRYAFEHDGEQATADLFTPARRLAFQRMLGAGASRLRGLAADVGVRHRCIDTRDDAWEAVGYLLGRHGGRRSP